MTGAENENEASRFRALLNPILDLAASWGVDVAKELTDYAHSLGIDLDGDADGDADQETDAELPSAPVDFAEAALLVQGSTSIYSRKVEHLYGLVYKAVAELNMLRGKDKGSGNGTIEPSSQDADADKLLDVDKINFLDLNDVEVQTADDKAITLAEEELPPVGSLQDSTTMRPIPPMLTRGNASDDYNLERSNFKMLTAHTHPSGALIMDGCPPINEDLSILPTPNTANDANVFHLESDDDRDNDFPAMDDDNDDAGFLTPPPASSTFENHDIIVGVASSAKKKTREPRVIPREARKVVKPKKDPFLMLDPHEPIESLYKPLRVGKTYRRPRTSKLDETSLEDSILFDENLASDVDLTYGILDPIPSGASVRSCLCFEGLRKPYREVLRRRLAIKRRKAFESHRLVDQALVFDKEDDDMETEIPGVDVRPHVSFANEDEFGGCDFDDEPDDFPAFPNLDDDDINGSGGEINEAFESGRRFSDQFEKMASEYTRVCREHLQKTAQMWQQRSADEELTQRVKTWEDRIRPYLDEEELRPAYDIGTYIQSVVSRLSTSENSTTITERRMKSLFQAPERFEVCRFFLATLQLANVYTVEIAASTFDGISDPSVTLLSPTGGIVDGDQITPKRSKRSRQPGSTPKSARRPPLRSRLEV